MKKRKRLFVDQNNVPILMTYRLAWVLVAEIMASVV
jgi:hypothetical protein